MSKSEFKIDDEVYVAECQDEVNYYLSIRVRSGWIDGIKESKGMPRYYNVYMHPANDPQGAASLTKVSEEFVFGTEKEAKKFAIERVIERREWSIRLKKTEIKAMNELIEKNETAIKDLKECLKSL